MGWSNLDLNREVGLLQLLALADRELGGVDDHHMVTGVDVRSPDRLVLPAQQRRDFRRHAPEDRAVSVDDEPTPRDVFGLGRKRAQEDSLVRSGTAVRRR